MTRTLAAAFLLLPLLAGCLTAGEVTPTLEFLVQPTSTTATVESTGKTLGIRPLASAQHLTTVMARVGAGGELFRYRDARWAELPALATSRALRDAIAQTNQFADVSDAADMARPDFILTGELRDFQEVQRSDASFARISARIEVREARGTHLVYAETLTEEEPLPNASPASLAIGIETALGRLASRAAAALSAAPAAS